MNLLQRHIFQSVFFSCAAAVGLFAFVLTVGNVVRDLLGYLVAGQLAPELFLELLLLIPPFVLSYALPFGVLTGVLLVLGRMSAEHEITAIRAAGLSLLWVARPILILAVLGVGVGRVSRRTEQRGAQGPAQLYRAPDLHPGFPLQDALCRREERPGGQRFLAVGARRAGTGEEFDPGGRRHLRFRRAHRRPHPEPQPYPGGDTGSEESGKLHGAAADPGFREHQHPAAARRIVRPEHLPPQPSMVRAPETAGGVAAAGAAGRTRRTGATGAGPHEAAPGDPGQIHHGVRSVLVRPRGRAAGDQNLAAGDLGQPRPRTGAGDGLLLSHGGGRMARPASGTAPGSPTVAAESAFRRRGPVAVLAGGQAVKRGL